MKKEIIPNLQLWSKGSKNEFETAVVNQPSVFEPLKFYCISYFSSHLNSYCPKLLVSHSKFSGTRKFTLRYQWFETNFYFDLSRITYICIMISTSRNVQLYSWRRPYDCSFDCEPKMVQKIPYTCTGLRHLYRWGYHGYPGWGASVTEL